MDTTRWESRREFRLLNLIASFDFKTKSSISFHLGTYGDSLELPDAGESHFVAKNAVFNVIGWLDVHHPGAGHIKARLRVCLPDRYHDVNTMYELVREVFECLEIPADETFEAYFLTPASQTSIEQATDRNGFSDRTY